MSDTVIKVENLSKKYIIRHQQAQKYTALRDVIADGIKSVGRRLSGAKQDLSLGSTKEEFWALKDVSFEVKQGDRVGIIGRNGAGKSTLLKILSRITEPTAGKITLNGRVASLLEVGTGFHPELTGRENIYLNGAILGMGRTEIRKKFDEIVDFAEVEKFLDTPVKHYSSGMYVRLAFAVAAHLEPEILVVDEVLAVGDSQFQKKCLGKMDEISENEGRTVVFVSHSIAAIRKLCKQGILLNSGQLIHRGSASECCERYISYKNESLNSILSHIKKNDPAIIVEELTINGSSEDQIKLTHDIKYLVIEARGRVKKPARLALEIQIVDVYGSPIAFFSPTHDRGIVIEYLTGNFCLSESMKLPRIMRGVYFLNIHITNPNVVGWVDIPGALRIDSDGISTPLGQTFDYSVKGWILLSSAKKS
jgi:lipopolysaccharide transport system ATP-binding protein